MPVDEEVMARPEMLSAAGQNNPPVTLASGGMVLSFPRAARNYGVRLQMAATRNGKATLPLRFHSDTPLAAEIITGDQAMQWVQGGYTQVTLEKTSVVCTGQVTSHGGTVVRFSDRYTSLLSGGFVLSRSVTLGACGTGDIGFSTRFGLKCEDVLTTRDADFFVPGVWYKDNAQVPPGALAAQRDDRFFLIREDRLPLPLAAFREKTTGTTLSVQHVGGVPRTFAGEIGNKRIIDARMQFGSLGFLNEGRLETVFQMPGTEGERTYVNRNLPADSGWARRSHPVALGITQQYTLRIELSQTADYPGAVRRVWRGAVAATKMPVVRADLARVYHVSSDLLGTYCRRYNGVISVPFQVRIPSGEVIDTSSQMGFVGQALPSAALLLHYGLETRTADLTARATELVDFWVKNGMAPTGVPRNWYDIHPDGTVTWRKYNTFLRIASDGVGGALRAWQVARRAGQNKPDWLAFCRRYGDWLVRAQNSDGSYFRAYDLDGAPRDKSLDTTDHPIAFLNDLFCATGDARYRSAAMRAGEYCWSRVHQAYAYVGGTPDNPNVTDKEAGMMALGAFLSLHDVTGEKRWLDAATQAAWFSDTWVYGWNIPMPPGATDLAFPRSRTTYGLSLIATGHSGADNFMASAPFLYYRLGLLTGEDYFRERAQVLMHNTKQLVNWDDTLGYRYSGLLVEAMNLVSPRGKGVSGWLPWLTVAVLEPMVRLRETFGSFDIAEIERMPLGERQRRNRLFAEHRGFDSKSVAPLKRR